MIRFVSWLDRNAGRIIGVLLALALLGAVLALAACGDESPRPGTNQAAAAEAQGRANAAGLAADEAGRLAAELAAEAAAAEERAKATTVQADIDSAVEARVRAVAASERYKALRDIESDLATAADAKAKLAKREREDEQEAQAYRAWVRLCRLVGGAAILGGFLVAAVMAWATKDLRSGRWPGGILVAAGALTIALGPATAWLPWIVAVAAVATVVWWAWGHRLEHLAKERAAAAAIAGSRAVDAVERDISPKAKDAKIALADALAAAGLRDEVEARRGQLRDWTVQRG